MTRAGFRVVAILAALVASACLASVRAEPQVIPSYRNVLVPVLPAIVRVLVDIRPEVPRTVIVEQRWRRPHAFIRDRYAGSGSGVIIDAAKGLVLTNNHVVEGVSAVTVEIPDGRLLPGQIRGADPPTDLALIQIPPGGLVAATLDADDRLGVGDLVFAAGYPFDLELSVSMGTVGGLGRTSGHAYEDLIQTDARINPGSSGGALIDARGQVVGITNAAYMDELNAETGINYAIPSGLALRIARLLEENGEVTRPVIGVELRSVTPSIARALGLHRTTGILVTAVRRGLAADRAGLRAGDLVVAVDGEPELRASQLHNAIVVSGAKRELSLTVMRDGASHDVRIALDRVGREELRRFGAVFAKPRGAGAKGAEVIDLEPVISGFYGDEEPSIPSGLMVGDVVTAVNMRTVDDPAGLAADDIDDQDIVLSVRRNGELVILPLETPPR